MIFKIKTSKYFIVAILLFSINNSLGQISYELAFTDSGVNFEYPVEIQSPNDGTDRMFVVEQPGRIKVMPVDSTINSTDVDTFLDITDQVYFSNGQEIGLLGLAFHPEFNSNGYFYVYYSVNSPVSGISVRLVLSRFSVDPNNINSANPNSELVLFQFDKNQNNSNHNGGKIAFGPDSYLYISFGDGGGGNDPEGNGQNINTVFGSICRIDVDLNGDNPVESNPDLPNGNYEIPGDNPFVGVAGLDEIYAYGIRNTWKFSFDVPTGRLWGGDVGQNAFEEINIIEKGANYGWSRFEANSVANNDVIINEETVPPVFFYNRSQGDQSITGGYVYRGTEITSLNPNINSKYIFGDYVSGRVWALDYNATTGEASSELLFNLNGQFISSFGVDEKGELYFSDYGSNASIYKLVDGLTSSSGIVVSGVGDWSALDEEETNGEVLATASSSNGNLYVGGSFNQIGNLIANNIAVWNDNQGWNSLGIGSNGSINTLKLGLNGDLYAGGSFTEIGGISANNIAVWNGNSWSNLGTGTDGPVLSVEISNNGNIYAAGLFESIGGISARNIGYWNGSVWNILEDSSNAINGTNNEIRSLHFDSNEVLYVGGNFDEAGGNIANRIATWNGISWGTLGDGTSGFVQAISSTPTDVFLGGNFAVAGTTTVNRIARWNKASSSWFALDNGVNNNVNALIYDGTYLYAAGLFDIAFRINNNIIVDKIARWSSIDGWEALGSTTQVGVDIKVNTINFDAGTNTSDKIFVGGIFSRAGIVNTNNTAIWFSEPLGDNENDIVDFQIYTSFSPKLLFVKGILKVKTTLELYDMLGRLVLLNSLDQNLTSNIIDVSQLATGIYLVKINVGGQSNTKKVIIN